MNTIVLNIIKTLTLECDDHWNGNWMFLWGVSASCKSTLGRLWWCLTKQDRTGIVQFQLPKECPQCLEFQLDYMNSVDQAILRSYRILSQVAFEDHLEFAWSTHQPSLSPLLLMKGLSRTSSNQGLTDHLLLLLPWCETNSYFWNVWAFCMFDLSKVMLFSLQLFDSFLNLGW